MNTPLPASGRGAGGVRFLPFALLALLFTPALAYAPPGIVCGNCLRPPPTWRDDARAAKVVLVVAVAANRAGQGDEPGETELWVRRVVKAPADFKVPEVFTLPRRIDIDPKKPPLHFLLFCDLNGKEIDPSRGELIREGPAAATYLTGILALKDDDVAGRLAYCLRHVDAKDPGVAADAWAECVAVEGSELVRFGRKLDRKRLRELLESPKTQPTQFGRLALLLGACGKEADADLLESLLDRSDGKPAVGLLPLPAGGTNKEGLLVGYTLLKPGAGWHRIRRALEQKDRDFMDRWAALRAARFFWDSPRNPAEKRLAVDAVALLLDQPDIVDIAIEDFRRRACWEVADRVLSLYGRKEYDVPIIKRAVLRYALCAPKGHAGAAGIVRRAREDNPELVADTEDLLKLEQELEKEPAPKP